MYVHRVTEVCRHVTFTEDRISNYDPNDAFALCVNKIVDRSLGIIEMTFRVHRMEKDWPARRASIFHCRFITEAKTYTSGFHEYWITACVVDTVEQERQDVNVLRVW